MTSNGYWTEEEIADAMAILPDPSQAPNSGRLRAERTKKVIPEGLRWAVFERDDFRCLHCGSRRYLRADHIVAESKGGLAVLENLQTLCRSCNSRKGMRS